MEKRELTCIRCPMGCQLTVTVDGTNICVSGNTCPRGEQYGINEVLNPLRTVTGTIRVSGGNLPVVSVKTASEIPKQKIFDVMDQIKKKTVSAPVKTGDVLIKNVAGLGIDIVATATVNLVSFNIMLLE